MRYVLRNYIRNASPRSFVAPFLLALGGVVSDYVSTTIGLAMGLHETNPHYHPVWALLYFWGIIAVFALFMPKCKVRVLGVYALAIASYLGVLNNTLVILGVFPGIQV